MEVAMVVVVCHRLLALEAMLVLRHQEAPQTTAVHQSVEALLDPRVADLAPVLPVVQAARKEAASPHPLPSQARPALQLDQRQSIPARHLQSKSTVA